MPQLEKPKAIENTPHEPHNPTHLQLLRDRWSDKLNNLQQTFFPMNPELATAGIVPGPEIVPENSQVDPLPKNTNAFARRRTEDPSGRILIPQLDSTTNPDNTYLSQHADSRFFPPKVPWGERVGRKLGIRYRSITESFMGNTEKQTRSILKNDRKIAKAVDRAIDEALTPPEPRKYRLGRSLRYGVKRIAKPFVVTLGLIPGVEALVWDVPSAIGSAAQKKWREAALSLSLAAVDITPALVAIAVGLVTAGTGGVIVGLTGLASGWLTEWRYFHPYVRKHYADRDEGAMKKILEAFTSESFASRRTQTSFKEWSRAFPDQTRFALAVTQYGNKNIREGNIKSQNLKAMHSQLSRQIPQFQQAYEDGKAKVNDFLAKTNGKTPSIWHPVKRHQFNEAYVNMLDAYDNIQQFDRVNRMHQILFNAFATRNALNGRFAKP